jgi:hypothetical protein
MDDDLCILSNAVTSCGPSEMTGSDETRERGPRDVYGVETRIRVGARRGDSAVVVTPFVRLGKRSSPGTAPTS